MAYQLNCEGSLSAKNASEADIRRAFDDDAGRGSFAILEASDGSFLQTAGEGDGPYVLEHRDGATEKHEQSKGKLTKSQVRDAFLQYLHGDETWRTSREWETLEKSQGCLSVVMFAVTLGCLGAMLAE